MLHHFPETCRSSSHTMHKPNKVPHIHSMPLQHPVGSVLCSNSVILVHREKRKEQEAEKKKRVFQQERCNGKCIEWGVGEGYSGSCFGIIHFIQDGGRQAAGLAASPAVKPGISSKLSSFRHQFVLKHKLRVTASKPHLSARGTHKTQHTAFRKECCCQTPNFVHVCCVWHSTAETFSYSNGSENRQKAASSNLALWRNIKFFINSATRGKP